MGKVLSVTGTRRETQKWHRCARSKANSPGQRWPNPLDSPSPLCSLVPRQTDRLSQSSKTAYAEEDAAPSPGLPRGSRTTHSHRQAAGSPNEGHSFSSRTGELGTKLLLRTAPEGLQAGAKPRQGPLCLIARWLLSCGPQAAWKQHQRHQCHIAPRNLEAVTLQKTCKRPVLVFANEPSHALTKGCWVCCTQWVTSCHSVKSLAVCHISRLPSACWLVKVMADPRSRTIVSLRTKRMSLALLLSGDSSVCFSTCPSHRPFCLIRHVNYFETRLFSDHIFSLYSLDSPLGQSQGIKKTWRNISECACALWGRSSPVPSFPSPTAQCYVLLHYLSLVGSL